MPVLPATDETLDRAAALIRSGAVVAFPTETVYGLGANAFDAAAVARIFEIKNRPTFDPLIVHVRPSMLADVVESVPEIAGALIERFWPGPLTLVMKKSRRIPEIVTSGLDTVAVRMPSHPVAQALLERAGVPLAAPSANPFGYLSPTRAEHVARMLGERVDLIVDGGTTMHGVESTILLLEPQLTLLRHGAVPIEEIEAIAGPAARELSDATRPLAPGRLPQHYAPSTPIRLIASGSGVPRAERSDAALLAFRSQAEGYAQVRVLSPAGDLREAAAHLFELLHELDASRVSRIDVEMVPHEGIGVAIMDRLRRAAHR
ncbi:MAG TPA: L-threonylcarbamoyladenylate synthase [Candidatus Aquilonibacter sp.]|nr:L-threonylcarbamoyladenylate synthase [Candidatus Aquilonibacter sp.]